MKRKDLEQVYHLKKELRQWQDELKVLEADLDMSPKPIDGMPFQNTNKTSAPVEEKAIRLADTKRVIEGKIAEIQIAVSQIDIFIVSLDNPFTRRVVYNRCVRCLSWREIAYELGEGYSAETVRQHYHRFVKKLEK